MSAPEASADQQWRPKHNPWLITAAVMAATFMEVLDTSVANVSLPHIAGNLSATNEEATWVLTSYLVSNAIVLPATGWLGSFFGRKRLLVFCIALFTLTSALCGMAPSLGFLVVARILQGVGGGVLQPISQAVLLETFPPAKRGMAMGVWAMGVVVAPILGPTLGGWITDNYSWRWIFYINLPVGIAAAMMAHAFVEDPPYLKRDRNSRIDFIGFGLLIVWLATLQVILDKGQQEDWFETPWITWFAVLSGLSLIGFIVWELRVRDPIVNVRILGNRNFAVGIFLVTLLGAVLYGTTAALPLFMQTLLGYPALQSGIALSPRGIAAFVASMVVGRIVGKVSNRLLMSIGFGLLTVSSLMLGRVNLSMDVSAIIWPSVLNGLAISFIFVPLTSSAMGQLGREQIGNATGVFNLMRNIGGSIGIALITTLLARGSQVHQALMIEHLSPLNPEYPHRLAVIQAGLTPQSGSHVAGEQALRLVYGTLQTQASVWAYVDNFRLFALLCLLCVPVAWLFRKVAKRPGAADAAMH